MRRVWLPLIAVLALALQGVGIALSVGDAVEVACAQSPPRGTAMRVLLVTQDRREPGFAAWRDRLRNIGVPFDTFVAGRRDALRERDLVDARGRGRYQAVVLAVDPLLPPAERRVLDAYERRFGIREVVAGAAPGARGIDVPGRFTRLRGDARVTPAGRRVFDGLRALPVDGLFARPAEGVPRSRVLVAKNGRPLVVRVSEPDGRERLVSLIESPSVALSSLLLIPEMLGWATGGVHLGAHGQYLAVQVDDVLLPNYRWDPVRNETRKANPIRMTAKDVRDILRWSERTGVRLDMAYNGAGAEQRRPLGCERPSDPLTLDLVDAKDEFGWLNHTFTHKDLDDVPREQLIREIAQNIRWARDTGIPIDPTELATGEHSGLANPALPGALAATGIEWIASDASREPEQRRLGPALTVPRWAPNIGYDVARKANLVDQYNYRYAEDCRPDECLPRVDWAALRDREAERLLQFLLGNDPRPLYLHQSNLAEDQVLLSMLDALLERGAEFTDLDLIQPTLSEAGEELRRRDRYAEALAAGAVRAYRDGNRLTLTASEDAWVPLTTPTESGWLRLRAGERRGVALP